MYHTPSGTRVLQGAERRLFVESLAMIVDMLDDRDYQTGIPVLDDLGWNQKVATYHAAARALLVEDEPPPAPAAVIEAAIASVYYHTGDMLSAELNDDFIDFDDGEMARVTAGRKLAIAAGIELEIADDLDLDDPDYDNWELLVDCLQGRVLWDDDWALVGALDADPQLARRVKTELGISQDYFVAIPGDPSDAEAERLRAELVTLTADAR